MRKWVGWWKLSTEGVKELDEISLEHIAGLIKEGFTEGQIIQDEDTSESDEL